jgi:hypothetical protein
MILADTHWGLQAKDEAAKVAIVREYQETQQALAKKQAADRKAKRKALNGKSGGTRIESTHARPFARTPAWANAVAQSAYANLRVRRVQLDWRGRRRR